MAVQFGVKYKLDKSDNFDEYLKKCDVNMMNRKLATSVNPTVEFIKNGDEILFKTVTTIKTIELKFKLGEEFDETTADGKKVKTTFTMEGNKLVQVQKLKNDSTSVVREFNGDELTVTMTVGDVVCIRIYKKVK